MTQDEIIDRDEVLKMAKQAGLTHFYDSEGHCTGITDADLITADKEKNDARLVEMLMPFAKLVVQHERDRIISANELVIEHVNEHIKQLHYAVQAEREACAKYVEGLTVGGTPLTVVMGAIGDAIRARGETTSRGEA